MFSNSEVKGHPMRTIIKRRIGEMQKQNSDEHHFFKCPICSFRTPLRGDLQKHISMYHKQVFVCKICTSKFSSRSDLAEHKRLSHLNYQEENDEGRVYSCHKCGSRFDNAKIFAVHVVYHLFTGYKSPRTVKLGNNHVILSILTGCL